MAPRVSKSSYLKKCSITVEGSLGKDAKISDVEKWTVNNGGTFKPKINGGTTHVICTWNTYKDNDFALPKKYANNKKLQFVKWDWMDETLRDRRVKPTKKYLHPRNWEMSKADKKAARRYALLTSKSIDDNDTVQTTKIESAEILKGHTQTDGETNGDTNTSTYGDTTEEAEEDVKEDVSLEDAGQNTQTEASLVGNEA